MSLRILTFAAEPLTQDEAIADAKRLFGEARYRQIMMSSDWFMLRLLLNPPAQITPSKLRVIRDQSRRQAESARFIEAALSDALAALGRIDSSLPPVPGSSDRTEGAEET